MMMNLTMLIQTLKPSAIKVSDLGASTTLSMMSMAMMDLMTLSTTTTQSTVTTILTARAFTQTLS